MIRTHVYQYKLSLDFTREPLLLYGGFDPDRSPAQQQITPSLHNDEFNNDEYSLQRALYIHDGNKRPSNSAITSSAATTATTITPMPVGSTNTEGLSTTSSVATTALSTTPTPVGSTTSSADTTATTTTPTPYEYGPAEIEALLEQEEAEFGDSFAMFKNEFLKKLDDFENTSGQQLSKYEYLKEWEARMELKIMEQCKEALHHLWLTEFGAMVSRWDIASGEGGEVEEAEEVEGVEGVEGWVPQTAQVSEEEEEEYQMLCSIYYQTQHFIKMHLRPAREFFEAHCRTESQPTIDDAHHAIDHFFEHSEIRRAVREGNVTAAKSLCLGVLDLATITSATGTSWHQDRKALGKYHHKADDLAARRRVGVLPVVFGGRGPRRMDKAPADSFVFEAHHLPFGRRRRRPTSTLTQTPPPSCALDWKAPKTDQLNYV